MKGLQLIKEAIEGMQSDLRLSQARGKVIRLQRLRGSLETFNDVEIAMMFRIPMSKRSEAIAAIDRWISDEEQYIKRLTKNVVDIHC